MCEYRDELARAEHGQMAAGPETQQGQATHTATRCADTTAMSQESEVALKRGTGATVLVACR